MKLTKLTIRNFRCLKELSLDLGAMHALVGANNAGKSTVLKALDLFFNPSTRSIDEEAFCGNDTKTPIEIEGLFTELTPAEKEKLAANTLSNGQFLMRRTITHTDGSGAGGGADSPEDKVEIATSFCRAQPPVEWLCDDKVSSKTIDGWWKEKGSLEFKGKSFGATLGGSKPTVGEWKARASEFVNTHLTSSDMEAQWIKNPQGYPGVLKAILPHYVLVPAVRDAADESKVTKTGPFGKLVYEIIGTMDEQFRADLDLKLKETTKLLNKQGGGERAPGVTKLEERIDGYLKEVMEADVEIEFEAPTVEVILSTPRILVNDGFRGGLDGKGHGLQRAAIFAILRAYSDLMTASAAGGRRSVIIAVEEPELYMHPAAQRTIRKVFRKIVDLGDQVVFSTHSPLMVDVAYFDEIIRLDYSATPQQGGHRLGRTRRQLDMNALVEDIELRRPELKGKVTDRSMREQYSNAYSAGGNEGFFARKLILVEGPTEAYAMPIYAAAMSHDLDAASVGVIDCGGKKQIDRFYRIFNELGIPCYVLFDFDAGGKKEELEESLNLLKLVEGAAAKAPTAVMVGERAACFLQDWESDLSSEIDGYDALVLAATSALGIKKNQNKPLIARYIARELTARKPLVIPPTLKQIIEKAVKCEWQGSCLKRNGVGQAEAKPENVEPKKVKESGRSELKESAEV